MILCPWSEIKTYEKAIPHLQEAIDFVAALKDLTPATYPLPHGKVMVQNGTTREYETGLAEAHRKYLDIQLVLQGSEVCGWAKTSDLVLDGEFNESSDCGLYSGATTPIQINAGVCYVLFPEDAHKPCKHLGAPTEYTKLVIKLEL